MMMTVQRKIYILLCLICCFQLVSSFHFQSSLRTPGLQASIQHRKKNDRPIFRMHNLESNENSLSSGVAWKHQVNLATTFYGQQSIESPKSSLLKDYFICKLIDSEMGKIESDFQLNKVHRSQKDNELLGKRLTQFFAILKQDKNSNKEIKEELTSKISKIHSELSFLSLLSHVNQQSFDVNRTSDSFNVENISPHLNLTSKLNSKLGEIKSFNWKETLQRGKEWIKAGVSFFNRLQGKETIEKRDDLISKVMQEKENDNNKNQSLPHAISTLYEDLQKKILFRQQIIQSFLLSFNSTYSITDTPGTEQPDSKILLSLIRQVDTSIRANMKKLILCKIERELQLFDKLIRHELDECRNHPKDLQFLLDEFAFLENQFTSLLFHRIYSSVKPMTASFCSSSSSACTCSPLSVEVNGSCHEQSVTPSMINDGHLSTVDNVIELISEEELNVLVQQVLVFKNRIGITRKDSPSRGMTLKSVSSLIRDGLRATDRVGVFFQDGVKSFLNDFSHLRRIISKAFHGSSLGASEVAVLHQTKRDLLKFIPMSMVLRLPTRIPLVYNPFIFFALQRSFPELFPSWFQEKEINRRREISRLHEKNQLDISNILEVKDSTELEEDTTPATPDQREQLFWRKEFEEWSEFLATANK